MRQAMEPVGLGPVEMWNNPEDGRWIYTKTMRVASFMWQMWKRGALGLLLLASVPILLPVLLLAFGVGFIFLLPFLPGVAAYFVLSRRFPVLRISGWYRYFTSYTPGPITSADTGVLEDEGTIVNEDDNIQPEESQETSDDVSQAIEEETVADTWSEPHVEGGEGNVFQEVSELSREPSFRPSPLEGIANVVQEGEEQSFSPEQHDIRSIEEEAAEGVDHEMGPERQDLPGEVLSLEIGTDEAPPLEYAAGDVSSEPSMPVEDFQRPFGGHEAKEEEGKENADLSLPVDVGDELASSEGDQGDEGKVLPQEESLAKADIPSQFEQLLPSRQQEEELDGKDVEGEQKVPIEESLAEPVPASDIPPPLEELLPSRQHKELDGILANQEEEKEVLTGEESPVEAVPGSDPSLSFEQVLPSGPHPEELDDKDVDEDEEKKVLTRGASPAETALDSDIPSPPKESLSSRHEHLNELDGKDVDEEGEKAFTEKASPAEAVSGSDLPFPSEQLLPSRPCQEGLDGKDVDEVEEKGLTGEASPAEAISGSDLRFSSEQLLPSRQQHEELDSKDEEEQEQEQEQEQEKALTGEASPAEATLDSVIPSPPEESSSSRHEHPGELDGKDVDEEGEKAFTEKASPAEAVSGSDLPSPSEQSSSSRPCHEQLDGKDVDEVEEKGLTGEAFPAEAISGSDLPFSSEQLLPSRQQREELDSKDEEEEKQEKALAGEASPAEAASDSDIPSPPEESLLSRHEHQEEVDGKDVEEVEEEKALIKEVSPSEAAVLDSDISSPFEELLQSRPCQEDLDAKDAVEVEGEEGLTREAFPAEAVSGSDLPSPSKQSLPSRQRQEAVDGIVADEEEEEKLLTGEESLGVEVSRTDLSTEPLLQQEEIEGKDADKKEEKDITGEESVDEAALHSDIPFPSEKALLPGQHQDAEELDGKDAHEEEEKEFLREEESPAEAVSPFDVVSEPLPSKSEDDEAGQVTKEHKSIADREPSAEESRNFESPSEYDSTQEEEEGRLEETVATNLPADHSLAQGDFHKHTGGDAAVEEEAAHDIFHDFESEIESEEEYFLSPGVSISEEFSEEELGITEPAHLQPPGGQGEQPYDMEAELKGKYFAQAAETTSEELASANHGQSEDNLLDKEEGVEESSVAVSASEKPWPAGVQNEIDISKPDEEEDKMAFKQQPANQELAGPDSKHLEEDQKQLDINVATAKDDLDNLKGSETKSEIEDITSSSVAPEELTKDGDIGFASEHPSLSINDDKELIKNEPTQEESQEDNIEAKDSADYNFGTGEEENKKAAMDINGEGELAEKNVHVEEPNSTNDISLNLNAEHPTTFPVSEQTSDSGPTPEYPRESDRMHESRGCPEDAQKDTQSEVAQEPVIPEEEESNTAHFMEQQDDKSPSSNPPDIVEETREEPTPGVGSDSSGLAKESHLQSGYLPELEIDDGESLNETEITGGMFLPEQEQRQKTSSDFNSSMPGEPSSPLKTTTSRDQDFAEGQQPGLLSPQLEPKSTVIGDGSQDSLSQESSHVAHSQRLEDNTLQESNTAHFMEQQDDKSPSSNPPDIVEETREEPTPGVGPDSSGLAKESRLQSGYLPELEIDDGESLNETEIPGGMLLPEQEQRQNVKTSSEFNSSMSGKPSSPLETTTSRDRDFAEGQQPGLLSLQLEPKSTVTEGDGSQDSPSQESSHVAHSQRLEDNTLEESVVADPHEVHGKEKNQAAEKMPSSQGSNEAGDMEMLNDDKNEEESNPLGKPTLLPRRRLSFSEAGNEVAAANLGVPFLEEHNKDHQPDHEELSLNASEYVWPSEAEEHGLNGTPRGQTEYEESVGDNSPRTVRLGEPSAQKPGSSDPVSEHPTLLLPDRPDCPEDWQISCRKRREDESRPDGVSPAEASLESPSSEEHTAMVKPSFEFFTHSPSQQQKSRTGGRRLSISKHNRSMNRRSAPELVRSQTWAADSATSPPPDASRGFKKAKYMDRPDFEEPMTPTSSASRAQGMEAFEGEFEGLLQYWKERDKATKSPDVSPIRTPPLMPSEEVERQVRGEISTMKRIVGQDIPPQDSLWDDVETLSQIVGIQLPNMGDVSDLAKARQGLELLKVVVGVRWDGPVI